MLKRVDVSVPHALELIDDTPLLHFWTKGSAKDGKAVCGAHFPVVSEQAVGLRTHNWAEVLAVCGDRVPNVY